MTTLFKVIKMIGLGSNTLSLFGLYQPKAISNLDARRK